jgi:exo-beta-1,3-glucanase (GH17 family)
MKQLISSLLIVLLMLAGCKPANESEKAKLEIKDGWFYINGEKFFVKAIGYELGARPGEHPKKDTIIDYERLRFDLKVIKDAGYNTIRTWAELSEKHLEIIQESGMKIMLGIGIKPDANYADSAFVQKAFEQTRNVVAYSKKFDCVITYLILNEPMTDHIYKCGAPAMINLMMGVKKILNTEHPGIPVSISGNTAITEFLDMSLYDLNSCNSYDYNEGQNGTLGFTGFLRWVKERDKNKMPLVITEFGYSVSNSGGGNNTYGGNTLEEQKNGLIRNYRAILDAGATALCPFYYADGWWKGGQDSLHNNTSEEWFGFIGYSDFNDTIGNARPVWDAMENYMKALIISPKNQMVYSNNVPLELYLDADIAKVVVKLQDSIIYSVNITKPGYFADTITFTNKGLIDTDIAFDFFDKTGKFIKTESIYALISDKPIELPKVTVEATPNDLAASKVCKMKVTVSNIGDFKVTTPVRMNFNPHIGWTPGTDFEVKLKDKSDATFEQIFTIPDDCWVMAATAGVTVRHGKINFRISDHKLILRGNWADGLGMK